MSEINTGGSAFPVPEENYLSNGTYSNPGMTLRDWFAGQALPQAIEDYDCMTRTSSDHEWVLPYATKATGSREEIIARQAYRYADAMLAAREVAK